MPIPYVKDKESRNKSTLICNFAFYLLNNFFSFFLNFKLNIKSFVTFTNNPHMIKLPNDTPFCLTSNFRCLRDFFISNHPSSFLCIYLFKI